MKKDRGVLERVLNELFEEYCANKEVENKLKKDLGTTRISTTSGVCLINTTMPSGTTSAVGFYAVTESAFNATAQHSLTPAT